MRVVARQATTFDVQEAWRLFTKERLSLSKIGARMNVTSTTVWRYFNAIPEYQRLKNAPGKPGSWYSEEERDFLKAKAWQMFCDGVPMSHIITRMGYGIGTTSVKEMLEENPLY